MKKTPEAVVMRRIQLSASKRGFRLFRNNVGVAWMGAPCRDCSKRLRRVRFGLCKGSSDLIGWTKDGRFIAVEVKAATKLTREQDNFLSAVHRSGGVAIVAMSERDL